MFPHNVILVSFDVKNLFTSVPTQDALLSLETHLNSVSIEPKARDDLIRLTKICLEQNYFIFNGKIYRQREGLAMGSPLSPILSEFFMDHLEEKLFNSGNPLLKHSLFWKRYVDDIFCVWGGSHRQLNVFLNHLNSLHPNLSFTMEIGKIRKINYLDITIAIEDGKPTFEIYRKPEFTDQIIPNSSFHHYSQKHAALHSMLHRLLSIPLSPEKFKKELDTIKCIATSNGYNQATVDKILKRKRRKQAFQKITPGLTPTEKTSVSWRRMPFLGNLSHKISNVLPANIRPAFRSPKNLLRLLGNSKDKRAIESISGVYELSCADCPTRYIGRTGRSLGVRAAEHHRDYRLKRGQPLSNFALHLLDNGHTSDFNPRCLHQENNSRRLDLLEEVEIRNFPEKDMLANEQLFLNPSPLLTLPSKLFT